MIALGAPVSPCQRSRQGARRSQADHEFYNTGGITAELHGRTEKTANIGIVSRQIPQSRIVFSGGKFDSKPKSLPVLNFHRMLCCGSKKRRWLIFQTN